MSSPDSDRLAGAFERTVEMATARVFAGMRRDEPLGELVSRSEGVADFARRRTRVVESWFLDKRGQPPRHPPSPKAPRLGDRAKQLADRAAGEAIRRLFDRTMRKPKELLYDGGSLFTRFDLGEPWMSFTPRRPDGPRHPSDPLWLLDVLVVAGDESDRLGQEEVRGVLTERYRLRLDAVAADERVSAGITVPESALPIRALRRLPAEIWLDADGRLRRMSHMVDSPDEVPDGPLWSTTEFADFGSPVDLPEPPAETKLRPVMDASVPSA